MRGQLLRDLLAADPDNLSLLAENAEEALREDRLADCRALVDRYRESGNTSAALSNLEGLLALKARDPVAAETWFNRAVETENSPAVRFNLAWARSLRGDFRAADAVLDDDAVMAAPNGPALKVEILHHLGDLERALQEGARWRALRPSDEALAGVLAVAALDAGQLNLAEVYAADGGETPNAWVVRGTLALDAQRPDGARRGFEQALIKRPNSARAAIGLGLALLATGDPTGADTLDRGAAGFKTHAGAWVAAAWAHFAQGDFATSRDRFEIACGLDGSFSEPHGGLAVLDVVAGALDDARRNTEVALRLDPTSFGGALAQVLLLASAGDTEQAARIYDLALKTPLGPDGRTIAQTLAKMATVRGGMA